MKNAGKGNTGQNHCYFLRKQEVHLESQSVSVALSREYSAPITGGLDQSIILFTCGPQSRIEKHISVYKHVDFFLMSNNKIPLVTFVSGKYGVGKQFYVESTEVQKKKCCSHVLSHI